HVLGADTRLTTSAVLVRTGQNAGTVTLVAGGDTTLAPDLGDPAEVMGYSGMGDLAQAVALELRRSSIETVNVRLDDTIFSGPALYPDWEWSPGSTWGAPVTPLAIMDGRAGAGFDAMSYFADPALAAAEQFRRLLAAAGADSSLALPTLNVSGNVSRAAAPANAEPLAAVESASMTQVVLHTVRASDNNLSESLGRMAAVRAGLPGSFEGCAAVVERALDELGVPTAGLVIDDCSGLSHSSTVPATTLAGALALAADPGSTDLGTVLRALPVGGLQGTLAKRFDEGSLAAGSVRAKTGTLTGVTALSGLVQTASGRELVFSVVAHPGETIWTDLARQSIDRFISGLAAL
ncbi:MAG: D-alanyl-D-alanine carboxypeptidase/D-alanyl-D-alanine-endopeptidase, partial [Bifidobacteriaceae bacterium]|nr:D-alanyl-D-alanine carboxypeptidase/D-alanyl-D-alanine-endopeptidase [Bifidobacteriaceae bacterium]